jgi:hypothetical protein
MLFYDIEGVTITRTIGKIYLAGSELGAYSCNMNIHCPVQDVWSILPQLVYKVFA